MNLRTEQRGFLKELAASRMFQRRDGGSYRDHLVRGGLIERDAHGRVRITEMGTRKAA